MNRKRSTKVELRGSHRIVRACDTLRAVEPLLAGFGITRVANITGLDHIGIPVTLVVRPNSRSLSVSQGKGLNIEAARVSGIMESIEQHCAEGIDRPLRLATYRDLRERHPTVDVNALPRFVRPFDPNQAILWIEASELGTAQPFHVPFEMVHLNLTEPLPAGSYMFPVGSNGLASGNSLAEATAHGLWELIERDAQALFYVLPPEEQWQRRIALDTIDDDDCRLLLDKFRGAGIRVAVWNLTSDTGLAVFMCGIVEETLDVFRPVGCAYGSGCHVDRAVALCRALTEAAQSRLTRLTGSRDDIASLEPMVSESAIREAQARFAEPVPSPASFTAAPTHRFDSFEADIDWTLARMRSVGLPAPLRVDLSPAGMPFSVVRILAPGLEGVAGLPGYVPGARARSLRRAS